MWTSFVVGFGVIGLALFLCAGTFDYWQAWAYLGTGMMTSGFVTLTVVKDPKLLASRTKAGPSAEKRPIQKVIVACAAVPGVAAYIVPGLDHRFGWSNAPAWVSIVGDALIIVSMWFVDRVFKENSFGAATIQVAEDQKVVSTGPYAIVRHPMYSGAAGYLIGLALALGSYWALIASVLTILALVWRLLDEEAFLARDLPGYSAYCARVRWRLVPGVF